MASYTKTCSLAKNLVNLTELGPRPVITWDQHERIRRNKEIWDNPESIVHRLPKHYQRVNNENDFNSENEYLFQVVLEQSCVGEADPDPVRTSYISILLRWEEDGRVEDRGLTDFMMNFRWLMNLSLCRKSQFCLSIVPNRTKDSGVVKASSRATTSRDRRSRRKFSQGIGSHVCGSPGWKRTFTTPRSWTRICAFRPPNACCGSSTGITAWISTYLRHPTLTSTPDWDCIWSDRFSSSWQKRLDWLGNSTTVLLKFISFPELPSNR